MESLLEIPGIFDAQKSPLPEPQSFFIKSNPKAKCDAEFERMIVYALFKVFTNKINARDKSNFHKELQKCPTFEDRQTMRAQFTQTSFNNFFDFVIRAFEFLGLQDEGLENGEELFERTEANLKWQTRLKHYCSEATYVKLSALNLLFPVMQPRAYSDKLAQQYFNFQRFD